MSTLRVPIAEVKSRFSEYVSRSAYGHEHVVITRRGKPVAALVGLDVLSLIENAERSEGLISALDAWDGAMEIAEAVEGAYKGRSEEGHGRDVSL